MSKGSWIGALSALGLGACSAAVGEVEVAPVVGVGFAAPTSSAAETGGAVAVQVRLTVSEGLSPAPVTVTVSDLGTGDATPGADYQTLAPTEVTFPAGSMSGTVLTVPVTLLADNSIEGDDQVIQLGIAAPTGGATLSNQVQHTLTIEEANLATIGFQTPGSATADESTGTHPVQLTLTYPGTDTLDASVSVTVSDIAAGTATAGVDYSAFGDQTVSFSAGTPSGSTQTLMLGVQDDSDFEIDETAVLGLSTGMSAVQVGQPTHTVTITNDDAAPVFTMIVSSDQPAPLDFPSSGDTFVFADASVGGGPTGKVDIFLDNLGTGDLGLSVLELSGDLRDFSIETGTTSALPELPTDLATPLVSESVSADQGAVLALAPERLAELEDRNEVVMHAFPLPDGGSVDLRLTRVPSPWTHDAILSIDGEAQPGGPEALLGDLSMWRGEVIGIQGSGAFLSFSEQGSRGWIRLSPAAEDVVHLVTESTEAGMVSHIVDAPALALLTNAIPEACGGELLPPGAVAPSLELDDSEPGIEALNVVEVTDVRLVIETDWQYYQNFGDSGQATAYVTQLIAAISDRYETDVQASLSVAYLGLHTTSADGWTSQEDSGAGTADLLYEFRDAWSTGWPATGDLAHFISGANLGGGIAYVDVLCNPSYGFGVSANINGNINWGSFTGGAGSLNWDFVVVAHELGHNFGASHTHSYCPPLDQCYANCNSANVCTQGTIMSYCHVCGGMSNIDLEFHPLIAGVIRGQIAASCLAGSTIEVGNNATFSLFFEPTSGTGAKAATLSFTHTASNLPSPYTLNLSGTATN